ncbi:MAG: TolC family protein, partial [Paludibacteraceae bacterium]|nr:TolC family protein [Paludibacteraceae bacterium]
EASIKFLIQIEKDVTILIENGISTPNEQLTINVKRNEAEIAKFKVKNWIRLSKMALAQYCGLPIESDYILTDEEKVLKSDELPLETTIERVFSNRIEIQKLSIVKKIYKEQENIERSKMLPSISFLGTYLGTNPSCYNGFQKKFSFDWHLGITIKIPLLHWGENIYTLKAAKCESNIHNLTIENVKQQIELEVEQKYIQMIESKKKFEIASRNLEQANENLRIAQEGFREGIISSSNLLEAQTTWVKATSEQIDAKIEIKMSESNYQKVIGIINPSNNE